MNTSYDKSSAVVVLPPVGGGRLKDRKLKAWLAQSNMVRMDSRTGLLERVLTEIGRPLPTAGCAAMRIWGQTGDRPTAWIAAADPVYLEPRLDHLCLHALCQSGAPPSELGPLIDHLQRTLADESGVGFARVGSYGYISANEEIATAGLPAYVIDRLVPTDFMPAGAGRERHRQLLSEIEMALHDHPVNLARQEAGLPPVNSLWIWGGGCAPDQQTEAHPPLFSDDALLRGYWYSKTGLVERWPGDIAGCLEVAVAGFVAETPEFEDDVELLESCLHELAEALRKGRVSSLVLLFRDGIRADIHRSHTFRIWRRRNTLLEEILE